jgi:GLPGLI family protein
LVLVIIPFVTAAQKSGVAIYSITYGYTDLMDAEAALRFNGNVSFFETQAGLNNTFSLVFEDTLISSRNSLMNTMANHSLVYTDLKSFKLITSNQLLLSQVYYTLEKPKSIKWNIQNDTKMVGKYSCQKATCRFRGRDYTAWFTREIPVEFGPWKFNGLPGLIAEVIESNSHVHILLQSFSTPYNEEIETLTAEKYLSLPEYFSLFKKEVLELTPDHPFRRIPNVKIFIDISTFTELETKE